MSPKSAMFIRQTTSPKVLRLIDSGAFIQSYQLEDGHQLIRLSFPENTDTTLGIREIADGIEEVERYGGNGETTTVWIDIQSYDIYQNKISGALTLMGFYGFKVFVSYQGMSSHEPGNLLPLKLRGIINNAHGGGVFWHPFAQAFVDIEGKTA